MMVGVSARPALRGKEDNTSRVPDVPALQIRLLGAFQLCVAGKPIPATLWSGSARARSLFQYLAYRADMPLSKGALLDRLWPDLEPEVGQNALHKAVHFLRQRLSYVTGRHGRELLDFDGGCYTLLAGDMQVDAVAFRRAMFQARWCERLGDADGHVRHLVQAIDLYGGDLLEEDYLVEWAIPERERLRQDLCRALHEVARLARAAGARDKAATYYQRLVAVEPCAEEGYQALIELALGDGRRGEALRLYKQCKEALHRELSLAPGAAIQQLMASL